MPKNTPVNTPKFTLFRTTLDVKRATVSGTRRGDPQTISEDIRCSEVMPLDSTAQAEAKAAGLSVDYQLFCDPDPVNGFRREDVVVVRGQEFVVVEVAEWPTTKPQAVHLMIRKYQ